MVGFSKKVKLKRGVGRSLLLEYFDPKDSIWLKGMVPALLEKKDGSHVRSSLFTTVLEFRNPESGEIFYFKEFHDRDMMEKLKAFFRSTRARRAFKAGKLLLEHGFCTPIPVMYGVERSFCFPIKNFLITNGVDGKKTYQYFESRFPTPLSSNSVAEKRALINAAGHEIGRLHRKGIFHGDLRVGNIIIQGRGRSALLFFIDNERTRYYKALPMRKRLKNLVQLNMASLAQITKTDRLRFLDSYISENPVLSSKNKRGLIQQIQKMTEKRLLSKFMRSNKKDFDT